MDKNWNLNNLYQGFEDETFKTDFNNVSKEIDNLKNWCKNNLKDTNEPIAKLETYIKMLNDFSKYYNLLMYAELVSSVESENNKALRIIRSLEELFTELSNPDVMFKSFLLKLDNLDTLINSSNLLKEHTYYLYSSKELAKYMLSEKEELLFAKLKLTGSSSWETLYNQITSNLMVDINLNNEDKKLPLSVIRNLAYDPNPITRKVAYNAELNAYKQIERSSAACLNAIKGEAITTAKIRGYNSILDMTLKNSRMDEETLNAMLESIKEYMPTFKKYFKHKANLLGHNNNLPFYDLFAPIGTVNMSFTCEDAAQFIIENFTNYSQKLGNFAKHAFDNHWVDWEPKEGKRGGAFCSNLHNIKQSRILSNFTGSFSDMLTIAHELGHAYHGECLKDSSYLNSNYSMPIAEVASTFCETLICNAALKKANKYEKLVILENDISGMAQVIVDIYSRYLFEDTLIKRRTEGNLSVTELKELMINCQVAAYGDGLNKDMLHPYMWICKPHYYSVDYNYYNYPYAFGLLFAKGLYSMYESEGNSFIDKYDKFLLETGKNNLLETGKLIGINIHDKKFWDSSLNIISKQIDEFVFKKTAH